MDPEEVMRMLIAFEAQRAREAGENPAKWIGDDAVGELPDYIYYDDDQDGEYDYIKLYAVEPSNKLTQYALDNIMASPFVQDTLIPQIESFYGTEPGSKDYRALLFDPSFRNRNAAGYVDELGDDTNTMYVSPYVAHNPFGTESTIAHEMVHLNQNLADFPTNRTQSYFGEIREHGLKKTIENAWSRFRNRKEIPPHETDASIISHILMGSREPQGTRDEFIDNTLYAGSGSQFDYIPRQETWKYEDRINEVLDHFESTGFFNFEEETGTSKRIPRRFSTGEYLLDRQLGEQSRQARQEEEEKKTMGLLNLFGLGGNR
tara:strand:+ start:9 stop:962 length:954 start_codon:yes stop_codon:yes gene_type:complete